MLENGQANELAEYYRKLGPIKDSGYRTDVSFRKNDMKEDRAQQDLGEGEGALAQALGHIHVAELAEKPASSSEKKPGRGRKPGKALLQTPKGREFQEGKDQRKRMGKCSWIWRQGVTVRLKGMVSLNGRGERSQKAKAEG